ncbi:hypothetical protein QE152_g25724 [Popillia japonica]|uniref:Reverse transcriptase domain-containing protein n=1 Tax=Popillia japonica TaxID=7064 RepID=A0AAW1JZJ9_POPJA
MLCHRHAIPSVQCKLETTTEESIIYRSYRLNYKERNHRRTNEIYHFTNMPFGLVNGPAIHSLENDVLGPLRFIIAMTYMDHILLPSATIEKGLVKHGGVESTSPCKSKTEPGISK